MFLCRCTYWYLIMKSIVIAGLLLGAAHGSAVSAGPYANVEANSGFAGSDYQATVTDIHIGYEGPVGESAGYYVQAGPSIVAVDGTDTTTELSGKAGIGFNVTESVNIYGEVAFSTVDGSDDNNYGTKVGVKYNF